jgi:hypothetical protein
VKLEGTEQKLTPTRHKPIREQEKNQRRIQTFQKGGDNCIFGSSIGCLDQDLAKNPSQL